MRLHKSGRFFGDSTAITSFASRAAYEKDPWEIKTRKQRSGQFEIPTGALFYRFIMLFHVMCFKSFFFLCFLRNWALDHFFPPSILTHLARISNSIFQARSDDDCLNHYLLASIAVRSARKKKRETVPRNFNKLRNWNVRRFVRWMRDWWRGF